MYLIKYWQLLTECLLILRNNRPAKKASLIEEEAQYSAKGNLPLNISLSKHFLQKSKVSVKVFMCWKWSSSLKSLKK